MAQTGRSDEKKGEYARPPVAGARGYDAGGHVAQLHADISRQIGGSEVSGYGDIHAERWVHGVSVVSGYAALMAGYAITAAAIYHWL